MKPVNQFFFFSSLLRFCFSSFLSYFFSFSLFIILISCNEKTVDPNQQLKSPFEMTWTADTIAYPGSMQTLLTSLWVSSPTDIWIAGHREGGTGYIYHFEGNSWKVIDPMNDVPRSTSSINQVMGVNYHDLWMVGDRRAYERKDLIINWNGTKWKEHNLNLQIRPLRIFANRSNDIWIGCDSAVVLHYDGVKWERDIPELNIPIGSSYFINGIVIKENITYLNVFVHDKAGKRYIFYFIKGRMNNWTVLDSMEQKNPQSIIKWGNRGLSLGNKGNIYSYGDWGLWIYSDNAWQHTIPINYTMLNIYELNENYKIAVGVYGMVWFYDGASWKQIDKFYSPDGDLYVSDVWTDGKEIIILSSTSNQFPQKTVKWRGK